MKSKNRLHPDERKWNKMMDKINKDRTNKNKIISVNIKGKMTVDEFTERVRDIVYEHEDIDIDATWFVALLESKFQNADIMIELANHFNYHVNEFKKVETEWKKYTPKIGVPKDILNLK
jgi:hypothetical protein